MADKEIEVTVKPSPERATATPPATGAGTGTGTGTTSPTTSATSSPLVRPTATPTPGTVQRDAELFPNVWSADFLDFTFNERSYAWQLESTRLSISRTSAISCRLRQVGGVDVVWMAHDFKFIGGSLGCAEGELLCRGFEKAEELGVPAVVVAMSGGARMQEGTLALMQMAKVSVAVQRFKSTGLPYISVCLDPTYGGTTASYAMQGDIRIAVRNARIGFAGESVILNTVYKMDQAAYDRDCPAGFQTAPFVLQHGQVDLLIDEPKQLDDAVAKILNVLVTARGRKLRAPEESTLAAKPADYKPDYTKSRRPDRIQCQDIIEKVFTGFVELAGDGRVGYDRCIRGGLALLEGCPCMVLGTFKGHEPNAMRDANFGMAEPAGYRMAARLYALAEHFGIPVVTLVDTPGAFPSFSSEVNGQPEAIATNLLIMGGLRVPIVTLFVGEGGSGGALAIAMGDRIGMLSDGYYGVITPEGAASILCRYPNDAEKAARFPADCRAIAEAQKIYPEDLLRLGVIDHIVWEEPGETFGACSGTLRLISQFLVTSLTELAALSPAELVDRRHAKFRAMGQFSRGPPRSPSPGGPPSARSALSRSAASQPLVPEVDGLLRLISDTVVNGPNSILWTSVPPDIAPIAPLRVPAEDLALRTAAGHEDTAKWILDNHGPDAVVTWLRAQRRVLVTDTTMRDAHQSILATRVRTADLLCVAEETSVRLRRAFSLEMWGGATFDVCVRFLHEDPWRRIRLLRQKIPNVCFQMLLRGSNAVGYLSYPDNVITEFIRLAAKNGIDVFRIFDCFNDLRQMRLCVQSVRAVGKIAEVAIAFSGNFLSPDEKIYTLDYYSGLARAISESGAHILAIKDMAGLFRPQMVAPFMAAIRRATDLPIHFHTHNTSSASLATLLEMSRNGCAIVDCAIASMSDTTSQPSLNAFLAAMEGDPRDPAIDFMSLERLDLAWTNIRAQYFPYESGLKSGTARVYDHQIPGGQYSNLIGQCKALGLWHRWGEVLDMYREVNRLFGDIIKVTPSSKVVGDMALFLINKNLTTRDVLERGHELDFPQSVVNLFRGQIGFPHHGLPEKLTAIVLKGAEPLKCRPGENLAPADFAAERSRLEAKHKRPVSDEDVITALLYPKEFDDYVVHTAKNGGELAMALPTYYFSFGMRIGASFTLVPFEPETPSAAPLVPMTITLQRVGPLSNENFRTVVFNIDRPKLAQQRHEIKIRETRQEVSGSDLTTLANPADRTQIPSPLPGVVDKLYVAVGDAVKKGTVLLSVAAMKMEVQVVAPFAGEVERLCVQVGTKVDNKTLLLQLKES